MNKKMFGKTKVLVVALLTLAMLVSLVACGKGEGKDTADKTTNTGNQSTETEKQGTEDGKQTTDEGKQDAETEKTQMEKVDEYFADYPAIDLNGRTIKIGMFWDQYYDSTHSTPQDNPNVQDVELSQMMIDNVRRIEKKYNCRIEYVNPGSEALINSLNTSVVAGTPDYDAYITQTWFAMGLALNGYFLNMEDMAQSFSKCATDKGVIRFVPLAGTNCFFEGSTLNTASIFMVYNKDMLKALNLEDPNELYAKGEWTWDKFAELAAAATQDTDNNGETDIYGYGGGVGNTLQEFFASNNAVLIKDGKENLSDTKVLETFEFLNKIYNVDKVARPMTDDYNADAFAFCDGKVAFSAMALWILQSSLDTMNFEYSIVPWPVGPNGDGSVTGKYYNDYYAIPKGVENPKAVLQVIEEFFGWHAAISELRDGESIATVESILQSEEDVETYCEINSKAGDDDWTMVDENTGYIISGIFNSVVTGEKTPAQALEANKQLWQDSINQLFGTAE